MPGPGRRILSKGKHKWCAQFDTAASDLLIFLPAAASKSRIQEAFKRMTWLMHRPTSVEELLSCQPAGLDQRSVHGRAGSGLSFDFAFSRELKSKDYIQFVCVCLCVGVGGRGACTYLPFSMWAAVFLGPGEARGSNNSTGAASVILVFLPGFLV